MNWLHQPEATGHNRSRQRDGTVAPLSPQITVCNGKKVHPHHPAPHPLEEDEPLLSQAHSHQMLPIAVSSYHHQDSLQSEIKRFTLLKQIFVCIAMPTLSDTPYAFHIIPSTQISKKDKQIVGNYQCTTQTIVAKDSKLVTFLVDVSKAYFSSASSVLNAYFVLVNTQISRAQTAHTETLSN